MQPRPFLPSRYSIRPYQPVTCWHAPDRRSQRLSTNLFTRESSVREHTRDKKVSDIAFRPVLRAIATVVASTFSPTSGEAAAMHATLPSSFCQGLFCAFDLCVDARSSAPASYRWTEPPRRPRPGGPAQPAGACPAAGQPESPVSAQEVVRAQPPTSSMSASVKCPHHSNRKAPARAFSSGSCQARNQGVSRPVGGRTQLYIADCPRTDSLNRALTCDDAPTGHSKCRAARSSTARQFPARARSDSSFATPCRVQTGSRE